MKASSIRHASGEYLLLKVGQFEISTQYLCDRKTPPSISNFYQIERTRNNPTNQLLLFDESTSEAPIFVMLCYGIDSIGVFAFLFLPSSGLYLLERKDLVPQALSTIPEEIPASIPRFIHDARAEKKQS